jgi:hypothetical protein
VDHYQVDGVSSLEVHLPPAVLIGSGVSGCTSAPLSVGVTIHSSGRNTAPTNTALLCWTSL